MALVGGPFAGAIELLAPAAAVGVGAVAGGLLGAHAGGKSVEGVARANRDHVRAGEVLVLAIGPAGPATRPIRALFRRHGARLVRHGLA